MTNWEKHYPLDLQKMCNIVGPETKDIRDHKNCESRYWLQIFFRQTMIQIFQRLPE